MQDKDAIEKKTLQYWGKTRLHKGSLEISGAWINETLLYIQEPSRDRVSD